MSDYDIIVIGGGPAGLTAAVYARRAGKTVLVLEKAAFGGQITFSPKVENIPGLISVTGNDFAASLVDQAMALGADLEAEEALEIRTGERIAVVTDCGEYSCGAVIVATGARHRMLGVPGEEELVGAGVSFCAVCDGAFYTGRRVGVVGGGNSALQEAILLSELAEKVTVIQNLDFLTGEAALQDSLLKKDNVEVILGHTVSRVVGDGSLRAVVIKDEAGNEREIELDGLFVAIGLLPQNEPFGGVLPLDGAGYADCGENCETPTPGVFVAGDCRKKQTRQVTTACADGAVAALAACRYIDRQ